MNAVQLDQNPSEELSEEEVWDRASSIRSSVQSHDRRSSVASRITNAYKHRTAVVDTPVGLSPFLTASIVVNYISFGYVLLPWAFAQGGTLLSCVVLALTALQSDITSTFVLEACARAEALRNAGNSREFSRYCPSPTSGQSREVNESQELGCMDPSRELQQEIPHCPSPTSDQPREFHESQGLGMSPTGELQQEMPEMPREDESPQPRHRLPRNYSMAVRKHTYELSTLCRIFLGNKARAFFTFTTAFDLYGITWAVAAIFGTTMADQLPIGSDKDYYIYILIFAAITIPLACVPVIDQVWIQMCFLVARTVMVVMMIITVAVGYASNIPQFGVQDGPVKDVPLADFSNLMVVIQLCIFSSAFQFAVPGLAGTSLDKKVMLEIFASAVSYIFATNLIVGLMLAIYFGTEGISQSSNLNWLDFHGGTWDGTGNVESERAGWANFIANYVVLFAAIDGVAVFPLICVSLGNILLGAVYGEKAHEYSNDWKRRLAFRLLASIPQTIGALFVNNLSAM